MKCYVPKLLLVPALMLLQLNIFAGDGDKATAPVSKPGFYSGYSIKEYKGYKYISHYVNMRDSILLAVDIFLPKKLEKGKKVPAILYLTRYVRSVQAKFPFNLFVDPVLTSISEKEVEFFTSYGYACVVVDVRGTGASQGDRRMEFSPTEVADGKDIVDWLVKQDWCNGNIGTTGVSYLGTTAEMLLVNQHPSVKACIPRSNIFDLYSHVLYPGGVCQGPFVDVWGYTTHCLDNNNFSAFGKRAKLAKGIHPVKGDKKSEILKSCIADHKKNYDVFSGLQRIKFRDDLDTVMNASSNDFSIHAKKDLIAGSRTPMYRIGGWYDGSLAKSCLDGYLNTPNTVKVLVGPWDHGPQSNVSPFAESKQLNLNVRAEMLRFFDHYLKGVENGINKEPVFTYYTVGAEKWEASTTWPVKEAQPLKMYLSADKSITASTGKMKEGALNYKIDYTATSGNTSRWNSVTTLYMHGKTNYADRSEEGKKLLSFTSAPLSTASQITGSPVITLQLSADATDATVFCYLEDVTDTSVTYVTEGLFRPLHRKINDDVAYKTPYPDHSYNRADALDVKQGELMELTFDMLPISYQFKPGHSIRVSIAGADAGHFNLPEPKPENFTVSSTIASPSFIELPVVSK